MSQILISPAEKPFFLNLPSAARAAPSYPPLPRLSGLGQTEEPPVAASIAEMYQELLDWCNQNLGPDVCQSILPSRPIYLPPAKEGFGLPWWLWAIFGFFAAKILR